MREYALAVDLHTALKSKQTSSPEVHNLWFMILWVGGQMTLSQGLISDIYITFTTVAKLPL